MHRRPCSTPPGRGRPRRPWVIYRGIRQRSPNQRDREVIYRESRPGQMRGALRHRPGQMQGPSAGGRMRDFRRVSAQATRSGRRGADPGLRRAKRVRPGLGSPDDSLKAGGDARASSVTPNAASRFLAYPLRTILHMKKPSYSLVGRTVMAPSREQGSRGISWLLGRTMGSTL